MSKSCAKWDSIYSKKLSSPVNPAVPPEYIERNWILLKQGRVLDLASGDGAVSLFLAKHGFQITSVDISPVALKLLSSHLDAIAADYKVFARDLEDPGVDLTDIGRFDSIVIARYKPCDFLWSQLASLLVDGGTLMISTFNNSHHERTGFSQRFCLQQDELSSIDPRLELLDLEKDRALSGFDSYLFRKSLKV